ncbi:MAG: HAD-IIA family hydrolase [Phycisphaerae bacterium]|nr:HAD-IIA family hydrolase [Phycisphaerae bacterium]
MNIRGLLLDVEGVLVADKGYAAVPGAVAFVAAVRAASCPFRLISNNTTDDRPTIIAKLTQAGFDFALDELYTCTAAAVARLQAARARRCLVLGNTALRRIFLDAGFEVVDDADVDAVVVGLDTDLTYQRLQMACEAVVARQALLLALHHNRIYDDATGRPAPSVGALTAAIEYATRVEAAVIGKPSPAYFQQALDAVGVPPADVLVVSDDPLSDLAGAKRMGMRAAFVLSGKYRDESVLTQLPLDERPDCVTPRIGDLLTRQIIAL